MPTPVGDALEFPEQAAPSTPAAGVVRVFADSTGLRTIDDDGANVPLTAAAIFEFWRSCR
jgi:hypothetical protein